MMSEFDSNPRNDLIGDILKEYSKTGEDDRFLKLEFRMKEGESI